MQQVELFGKVKTTNRKLNVAAIRWAPKAITKHFLSNKVILIKIFKYNNKWIFS